MKLKNIIPYLLTLLIGLSGCSILSNLQQISEVGDYSRAKDDQHRLVKSINDRYDTLLAVISQGKINGYKDETSFVHSFGQPILTKDLGDGTQRWLYRYAIFRLAKDKVYVYFDRDGREIKWERLPCSSFY